MRPPICFIVLAGILQDHLRCLLGDHDDREIRIPRHERRHHRAIDDPKAADPSHLQPRVDHGIGIGSHPAGAGGVEDGRAVVAREREKVFIGPGRGTGQHLLGHVALERLRGREGPGELDGARGTAPIEIGREIVGMHQRRGERISRGECHVPPARGPQLAHRKREAGERMRLGARHVGTERGDVELDVGTFAFALHDGGEQPALVDADGERAAAEEKPLQSDLHSADDGPQLIVGGDRLRAFVDEAHLQVVLQVAADGGPVEAQARPCLLYTSRCV